MLEAGVLVDMEGRPIYWHIPPGRHGGALPDSRSLWDTFFAFKDVIGGFAHTHPGSGVPGPSSEDVTTFSALELGLGKRFTWWIASSTHLTVVKFKGPGRYGYQLSIPEGDEPGWLPFLRLISQYNQKE